MIRVLHVTPHLGGGVGRALSALIAADGRHNPDHAHRIICLEQPEKLGAVERIRGLGCPVLIAPPPADIAAEIRQADVVQVEFWNHPALMRTLCGGGLPPMRLLLWCHVSGLHFPRLPIALVEAAQRTVLTSPCTRDVPAIAASDAARRGRVGVVSSAAGLEDLPQPAQRARAGAVTYGYVGTLGFAKLHPDFVALLAGATVPGLTVRMLGDMENRPVLERQCRSVGRPDLLEFRGYSADVVGELQQLDVFPYLLNPYHYGTAEIALMEAMAMGVVPVVLDNPAERQLVADGETGLIARGPSDLAEKLRRVGTDATYRRHLSEAGCAVIRSRFTLAAMAAGFRQQYAAVMTEPKAEIGFPSLLGATAADWFSAFLPDRSIFTLDGGVHLPDDASAHVYRERTKGSVHHFHAAFPDDPLLGAWSAGLTAADGERAALSC